MFRAIKKGYSRAAAALRQRQLDRKSLKNMRRTWHWYEYADTIVREGARSAPMDPLEHNAEHAVRQHRKGLKRPLRAWPLRSTLKLGECEVSNPAFSPKKRAEKQKVDYIISIESSYFRCFNRAYRGLSLRIAQKSVRSI